MAIPWVTALHLARKLLPIVIDKAPELFKTFGRFRSVSPMQEAGPFDPALAALQEQIEVHQRTIAAQAETIGHLRTTLGATKRSATAAWCILAATTLLSVTLLLYLLIRS